MTERVAGATTAPPTPWRARAPISIPWLVDKPPISEAPPKSSSPATKTRRWPSRSAARPPSRRKPANVSVYAFTTHWRSVAEKPRSLRIDGSATFTIETSRMTMNCAVQQRTRVQSFRRLSVTGCPRNVTSTRRTASPGRGLIAVMAGGTTRRELFRTGMAAGLALSGLDWAAGLRDALAAPAARCGRLSDVEHVVIFVQENRSFDHYFGTYRAVRGFSDPAGGAFAQPGYPAPGFGGRLMPFHLDTTKNGECTHDVTHDWGPQQRSWNGGAMDGFVREHVAAEGTADGALTMGYYERSDLAYYHALADAFTLCDRYHCSVIGPTDPNQLMLISGTLDPAGRAGGPMLETTQQRSPRFSWTTMPEQLRARGVTWKAYLAADNFSPEGDTPLTLFRQYASDPELSSLAFGNSFPSQFQADCANGSLPQVSWIWGSIAQSGHPPAPVEWDQYTTDQVLRALTANPELWAKTALLVTWDENGGFFDHVPPPVAPPGTPGEYVTVDPLPDA